MLPSLRLQRLPGNDRKECLSEMDPSARVKRFIPVKVRLTFE